ncbi:WXG100 family type VII secretion target [Saccharomonospora piscinae]|uniref:WXG100 family type VII secretion target n=1 Tax=Saccharomonospora piscinae TaxID=687388 RepID=UPI0004663D2C|nr:PPE domain-containing protein [Saccharomonospora piscinae]
MTVPHGHPLPPLSCLPWPVPEPPLVEADFHDDIDWATFSHEELYRMATDGIDLEGATEIAARWSRLGAELDEIGTELNRALEWSADAWQGEAAQETRETMSRLVTWTRDTADASNEVCGCVTEQAELAATAAGQMPQPVPPMRPLEPEREPFAGAAVLVEDPGPGRQDVTLAHRRAAEVMTRYQEQSRAIYPRVPAFPDPDPDEVRIDSDPDGGGGGGGGSDDSTTTSGVPGGGAATPPVGAVPGSAAGGPATGAAPAAGAPGALPPGSTTAVGPTTSSAAQAAPVSRPGGAAGPVPMGGGAGAARRGEDDAEHHRPAYLQEDTEDLWTDGAPVTPPVIGENPHPGARP